MTPDIDVREPAPVSLPTWPERLLVGFDGRVVGNISARADGSVLAYIDALDSVAVAPTPKAALAWIRERVTK